MLIRVGSLPCSTCIAAEEEEISKFKSSQNLISRSKSRVFSPISLRLSGGRVQKQRGCKKKETTRTWNDSFYAPLSLARSDLAKEAKDKPRRPISTRLFRKDFFYWGLLLCGTEFMALATQWYKKCQRSRSIHVSVPFEHIARHTYQDKKEQWNEERARFTLQSQLFSTLQPSPFCCQISEGKCVVTSCEQSQRETRWGGNLTMCASAAAAAATQRRSFAFFYVSVWLSLSLSSETTSKQVTGLEIQFSFWCWSPQFAHKLLSVAILRRKRDQN